ncbi:APC family permease [Caenibacillus caldisaponilyticus]|uniref:APC family permease n=1 Tax=Caenibacillus caldisaponilyticus TaxID=1674942 RepID=UPI0009884205|nr:APC family permease [Caenibacillus caldisaponilyticus]
MLTKLKRFLIGRPLKTNELQEQKLNKIKALAVLSSDALSSVAYGPEQILIVLATVGYMAFWYSLPIALGILILLVALILSYRQIIYAYPNGGGAYRVARENLGTNYGLIAGGSLLIDYILTVAVSVSAGTDALTSAFPGLHPYNVAIAVALVIVITILNLRGLSESATVLAYPVYLFILALGLVIVCGLYDILTGHATHGHVAAVGTPVAGISLFILLKAFSSGCSALTGVEAISNAVPNFKDPAPRNAGKTLAIMGCILGALFLGIIYLSYWYGIVPKADETVLSQLASHIFGRNGIYYFIQATTMMILVLAANTGFSAFPLLANNMADDKYMPRPFTVRGDRLGYSNGILTLGFASILLILIFHGNTENLIPLYAVGVFIPFTLSQVGMIAKWLRQRPKGWAVKLVINLTGALICFFVLMTFFVTKLDKVWMAILFIPGMLFIFRAIHKHYLNVADQLRIPLDSEMPVITNHIVVVPVAGITRVVERSIAYAKSLSENVVAVYIGFSNESIKEMEKKWEAWDCGVRLVTIHSQYRSIIHPLSKFIDTIKYKFNDEHTMITVVVPQFIPKRWWEMVLHNQTALLIRAYFMRTKNVVISTYPYTFKK